MKCLSSRTGVLDRPFVVVFFFRIRQRNVATCKTHVQSVQSYCFCSLNQLFCGFLVAVAVAVVLA